MNIPPLLSKAAALLVGMSTFGTRNKERLKFKLVYKRSFCNANMSYKENEIMKRLIEERKNRWKEERDKRERNETY
jgi:hypothetical protein